MLPRGSHRDRDWQTRAGSVELRIPRLRTGLWRDIAVECWATSQVDDGDVF